MRKYMLCNCFLPDKDPAAHRSGQSQFWLKTVWPACVIAMLLGFNAITAGLSHAAPFSVSSSLCLRGSTLIGTGVGIPLVLVESVPEPEPPSRPHRGKQFSKTDSDDNRGRAAWCRRRISMNMPSVGQELGSVIEGLLTLTVPPTYRFGKKSKTRCLPKTSI